MAELTENLIRLKMASGVGNLLLWRLLTHFGDADRLLGADASEIAKVEGVSPAKAAGILESASFDPRPEMDRAVDAGVNIIPYDDPEYPKPLLMSFDPPAVLYVFGRLTREDQVAVGIVGTRRASSYGRDQARNISAALVRAGYTVVSGLARGIDTHAHCGALDAGGRTVGVLGCGFDHMYPEENRDLAIEMTGSGAVVSEFPMATAPSRTTFPARNRIIAAMSLGVVVIEAPRSSGALITAGAASRIGRPVFAVPGRMGDASSEGCNQLIADGAVLVTGIDAIFGELNPSLPPPPLPERPKRGKKQAASGGLFGKDAPAKAAVGDSPANAPANPWTRERRGNGNAPVPANRKLTRDEGRDESAVPPTPVPKLSSEQRSVLAAVSGDWLSIDDIIENSGVESGKAASALAMLKILRLVEQGAGQVYRKTGSGA